MKYFIFYFFFLLPLRSKGQSTLGAVHGKVLDSEFTPLSLANISLLNVKDVIIASVISNNAGIFRFDKVPVGEYKIFITSVGFKSKVISFAIKDTLMELPNIILLKDEKMLNTVNIVEKKLPVEIRPDKIILNVASDINSIGSTVDQLLVKIPGARIINGDLIINGKSGINVYIDGKSVNVSKEDLEPFLKSISSSRIESIEYITNPSSKYDAAGSAGIINIKLKRDKAIGLNINISSIVNITSYNPKYEENVNFNYRGKNYNLYGNYSNSFGKYKSTMHYFRSQNNEADTLINYDQKSVNYEKISENSYYL
jgi:iron complex outermembrane receptor protein